MRKHRSHRISALIVGLLLLTVLILCASQLLAHGGAKTTEQHEQQITIMTYNTHRMGEFRKTEHNRIIHYIRRTHPDVVCLQEVEVYKNNKYLTLSELRDALRQYPYTYYDFKVYNKTRQFGNVIFSQYPLVNKETIRYNSRSNISSQCDMVVGEDTIRLIVNHLESNRFTRSDLKDLDSISYKWDVARKIRHAQARSVRQAIEASRHPIIVVGDFNDTPLSYTYQCIKKGLYDCWLECGGLGQYGSTLTKRGLGVRIDYILCSKNLSPLETHVDAVNYSDHYPLHATIAWK